MYQKIKKISKTNKITVEQLYNLGKNDMGSTLSGHESVDCQYKVLNVKINKDNRFEKYCGDAKRIIRHKVTKPKWEIDDEFGNTITITNDHSVMILRNGELIEFKPYDIDYNLDQLVCVKNGEVRLSDIMRIECVGEFEDEYVYDIEMDDENHTFVANNILVHNSIYASYKSIVDTTDWMEHKVWRLTKVNKQNDQKDFAYVSSGGYPTLEDAQKYFDIDSIDINKFTFDIDQIDPEGREFCLTLNRVFMSDFLKKIHEDYAKKNGTPNILDFELEAYNEAGIWLAKKKYLKNMTWAEPNVYYESCEKIKATGVEIAQTSSSPWVKKQLTDLVKWIFQQEEFTLDGFVKQLTKVKQQFMLQNVDVISLNKGMNKYNDYVLSDTGVIELQQKAMVTVQGAALYNYMINSNEKYKKKYNVLFDADKLCVVYIKPTSRYTYWQVRSMIPVKDYLKNPEMYKLVSDEKRTHDEKGKPYPCEMYVDIMEKCQCEAFAYPAGNYPVDMAEFITVDYERMFDLLVLKPINRIVEAMGYAEIDISMTFESGLW